MPAEPIHPARSIPFDTLRAEMDAAVGEGAVRVSTDAARPHLALYCYTQRAVYDKLWSRAALLARGLVLDIDAGRVLATPFPKFFNFGEHTAAIPDCPFTVHEKLDGSLGIIFHDGDGWTVATKGSLTSDQSRWARAWLDSRDLSALTIGHTYCAEVIYDANRIVVRYPFEGLVFLAAWDSAGREYTTDELANVAGYLDASVASVFHFDRFAAMQDAVSRFGSDREGFVVRFADGLRLKVKGAEYLRVHRLISRVTPLAVWEVMAAGGDLDVVRREIPEEFWSDFDAIRDALSSAAGRIESAVRAEVDARASQTDKEVGLALATMDPCVRPLIFAARRIGPRWTHDPKARAALFRQIRPAGNVLPGWTPSARLALAQEVSDA